VADTIAVGAIMAFENWWALKKKISLAHSKRCLIVAVLKFHFVAGARTLMGPTRLAFRNPKIVWIVT
jgi:hypothetical protein